METDLKGIILDIFDISRNILGQSAISALFRFCLPLRWAICGISRHRSRVLCLANARVVFVFAEKARTRQLHFAKNIAKEKLGGGLPASHGKIARRDYEDHGDRRDSVCRRCVDSGPWGSYCRHR